MPNGEFPDDSADSSGPDPGRRARVPRGTSDEGDSAPGAPGTEASPGAPAPADATPRGEDWETRYRYLLAEFDNFRKRSAREREAERRDARASVLRTLLPLYESFYRAREAADRLAGADPLKRGMDLLQREWDAFLEREGVTPVARPGDRFRPDEHEAVGEAPADAGHPDGTIAQVVQQGYRLPPGLLRPAKVLVARARAPGPVAEVSSAEAASDDERTAGRAYE